MQVRVRGAIAIVAAMIPGAARAGEPAAEDPGLPPAAVPSPAALPPPAPAPSPAAEPAAAGAGPLAGAPVDHGLPWRPFGYLRLQYIAVQNDPSVAFVGRDDGFELQNARLGATGTLDRIGFVIAFDGAVDERLQVNTPQGKLRVGLRDAYADARIGGRLVARGGLFQAAVDPEALVPDTERALIDHPIESRGMRATEGFQTPGLTPGRSLGAAIRLESERFSQRTAHDRAGAATALAPGLAGGSTPGLGLGFELAVQNGADEFASNNDNDKPALSAAVLGRLGDSWAMAALRYNPRTVGELPFRQDEDDLELTAGLRAVLGPVALSGAAVWLRTSYPTVGGPVQTGFGGHGQAMVTLPVALPIELGYRFGILDPSSLITTDRVIEHSAGCVLGLPSYHMRVQLQLTHVVEQAARALANDRAQLAAELVL
jgi:hypothetical protein